MRDMPTGDLLKPTTSASADFRTSAAVFCFARKIPTTATPHVSHENAGIPRVAARWCRTENGVDMLSACGNLKWEMGD
ncbi:hypothetical protein NCU16327 [Neurospora crassa OR74A]|uniref:Uncharacterized protein n=1 Tax=Neurospora crassa (strain ATCC 24698 / 74-OR23-1A / CBS 708.71 / DSM 1257 / FGSC 987) TaxID=367110 RepID=V5IPZ6_NEUCR|nr:hypothetical protein NCU16327 [Neurospora crassa OR74A]ESA43795.1 hypothetical protein NCU16327 [Neurospora crassa OR74A]|eukprot:XP_011393337.1 hypothetical protein NCU16327 [Neurospora crassa OR74A]